MRRSPPPPAALSAAPSRWSWFTLSEETRDYVNRVTEYGKRAIYYGWLPLILVLGASPAGLDLLSSIRLLEE